MSRPVVSPDEIADLTKRLAETLHAARVIGQKLESAEGTLALLARLRVQRIEDSLDTDLDALHRAAHLLLSVPERDPGI